MMRKRPAERSVRRRVVCDVEMADLDAVMAQYPAGKGPFFGAPTRCPDCGDFGMIDSVDRAEGHCQNHCMVCKREWVITLGALRERDRRPAHQATEAPLPSSGALYAALTEARPEPAPRPPAPTETTPRPLRARLGRLQIRPA
jgi:hypothetical protein